MLSFNDWLAGPGKIYGTANNPKAMENYSLYISNQASTKPIEQQTLEELKTGVHADGDYYKDVLATRESEAQKNKQQADLSTNYGIAKSALETSSGADTAEFQRLSPLAQRRMLGGLNARGLGASVAAGGSGSGALAELGKNQQQGLFGIQTGYQDLANNLEKQKLGDNIDLDAFYQNLARQRGYARDQQRSQQAGPLDYAKLAVGGAGLLI